MNALKLHFFNFTIKEGLKIFGASIVLYFYAELSTE